MSKQITLAKTLKIAKRKKEANPITNDKQPVSTVTSGGGGQVVIDLDEEEGIDDGAFLDGLSQEEAIKLEEELPEDLGDFFDDEDDEFQNVAAPAVREGAPPNTAEASPSTSMLSASLIQPEALPGFDDEMGHNWIYPVNYPIRDYQFNIAHKSLFKNTLVSLPTGLGKTFIAAVVMYNFYRWYPRGKVVFLAPTKPLVAQQIEACYKVVGIKQEAMAEMTGNMVPARRKEFWSSRRVFFLTPQVMQNDLGRHACPAEEVECVVFDEAHKALGNHAYCQVIRELLSVSSHFRVLALTATPGDDLKAVQQVVSNLLISQIELRSEDSFDIQQYTHRRKVEKIVVPLEGEIERLRVEFLKVLQTVMERLTRQKVVYSLPADRVHKFQLLQARDRFRANPPPNIQSQSQWNKIEGDFALGISLYHAFELLELHGMRSFYHFLMDNVMKGHSAFRARVELSKCPDLQDLLQAMETSYGSEGVEECDASSALSGSPRGKKSSGAWKPRPLPSGVFLYSHPKLQKLEEVVVQHFKQCEAEAKEAGRIVESRVMIFSQYRDSVREIADLLSRHAPLVRVMGFVGQASANKGMKGLSQKEQLEVVRQFRQGGHNTLVSTCVGEEGLDIGEVDLIVCFDANKSPIRLVQRMGRTGRKRDGRIVELVTKGKEEQTLMKSESNKKHIHKAVREGCKTLQFYQNSPRMVPRQFHPQLHKMHFHVDEFDPLLGKKASRSSSSKGKEKQGRLSFGLPLPKMSRQILTDHELVQWREKYALPEREAARVAHHVLAALSPGLLCGPILRHKGDKDKRPAEELFHLSEKVCRTHRHLVSYGGERGAEEEEETRLCDFGRWSGWQAAPGSVRLVPHSQRTKAYLATYELMDVLQQDSTDTGASYEVEMKTFLNKQDINVALLSPSSGRGDEEENTLPVFFKRRAKRAAIPSDDEDEDFLPVKKQLSANSDSTLGSSQSAGEHSGAACSVSMDGEEKQEECSSSNRARLPGTPLGHPSTAHCRPVLCDYEGDSPRGGDEASTDVPLPPSFSELDWLDGVTCTQPNSQLTTAPGMVSSPRKITSTPLRSTPPSSPNAGCEVDHETGSFQPLASSTVERATHKSNVFKVPLAISKRLSLSPSTLDTDQVSPELPRSDVSDGGVEMEEKGEGEGDKVEEEEGRVEGSALVASAHAPIRAATENLSTTVSCDVSDERDCEQECKVVNVIEESDVEEDGFIDPSTSKLLCSSPSMDQGVARGPVLTPRPPSPPCPASIPSHSGGGRGAITPEEESPLNIQRRKRRKRMHRRQGMLCSQFSPSPRQGGSPGCMAPDSTSIVCKKKCQIVISDDGSDGDFESPLRKPEKRARAWFGKADEDSQVEELAALAVNDSEGEEEEGIENCSDDSAENWEKCERKLSRKMTKEFVVDEAELSPDNIVQYSSDEPDDPDGYDYKDSFINDATMLTQVTPTRKTKGKKTRRDNPSPNMMGIYRRFLQSPNDVLFGGKDQRGGGRCRMVLSQRHGVLRKYAKKAGFKVPFVSPDGTVGPSSSVEEISGECETQSQGMDESSEAEEVQMLHYGEEEEEVEGDGERVEGDGERGEEELETQDLGEQAEEAAEYVGEEAFALEEDMDEVTQKAGGTFPFEVEHPSHSLSFAGGDLGVEPSVGEEELYHEVLDDLLADDIPFESFKPSRAASPCVSSLGTSRGPHCVQSPDKQSRQPLRGSDDTEERKERVGSFPKFRILRPGVSSQGEHTENVLTSVERTSLGPVGPGIVKCAQDSRSYPIESMKAFSLGMDEWMVSSDEEERENYKRTPEALHLRNETISDCLMQTDEPCSLPSVPVDQRMTDVDMSPPHASQLQEGVSPSPPPSPIIRGNRTPDLLSYSPIPPKPSRTGPTRNSSADLQRLKQQATTSGDSQIRIFADSRELSKSMIVTTLRQKHKMYVDVCQLSVCCFAVSYRMAVERRTVSELSTSSSAGKVAERLKQMGQTYERRVLIVEKDRVKDNKKMWMKPTKAGSYYEHCLAQLLQTDITLLFSDGPAATAQLLSELAQSEFHKGQRICHPYPTDPSKEKVLKILLHVPVISVPLAVGLCGAYTCFADLLQCTPQDTCTRLPSLSLNKAAKVHYFFQHQFCPELA